MLNSSNSILLWSKVDFFLLYNSLLSLPKSLITFDYVRLVLVKSHNNKSHPNALPCETTEPPVNRDEATKNI